MKAVLFISNGHGEIAIAARLAHMLRQRGDIRCDHLALVGTSWYSEQMNEVGPRRVMPSGGLIAMGNVRNLVRDITAGLLALTWKQYRFLRNIAGRYCACIAVGDVLALIAAYQAKARATVFVGTAKSVRVAPYGRFEQAIVRKADAVFVRDEPTSESLRAAKIGAQAANVIADFVQTDGLSAFSNAPLQIAIFPGSRESAYEDARFLASVIRLLARGREDVLGILSIAPSLHPARLIELLNADGWRIVGHSDPSRPFSAFDDGRELIAACTAPGEALLPMAQLVLGQAGTLNEAAAAAGIPVVAFVPDRERRKWYRRRQLQLLGDALLVLPRDAAEGAVALTELLADAERRNRMARAGKERMGPPGATARIVDRVIELCA